MTGAYLYSRKRGFNMFLITVDNIHQNSGFYRRKHLNKHLNAQGGRKISTQNEDAT